MKYFKVVIFVAIVVALLVANYFFGWSTWILDGSFEAWINSIVGQNPLLAYGIYALVSIVCAVALALPGVIFAIVAGTFFGPVMGTLLCWLSMAVASWLSFLIGRYFLKDALKPKLAKSQALNKLLFEGADKSDVYLLAITRLVPLFPFNLQNFAYGITDIRFAPYAIYSALFILPGTAVYTLGAAGIVDAEDRTMCLVLAGVLLVFSLLVAWLLKKKADIS